MDTNGHEAGFQAQSNCHVFFAVLLAILLAGCASRPSNPYFAEPESHALSAPPELLSVPDVAAPAMGHDVLVELAPPPPTNAPATNASARRPTPAPAPAQTPSRWGSGWITLDRFAGECGIGQPQKTVLPNTTRYSIPTRNGPLILTVGSKIARLNGLSVWLGFAPQVIRGEPCIHALDVEKTLQPISDLPVITTTARNIVIDPGHGGADSGTRGSKGEREKDYTLDWALRLERHLTNAGWHVTLTRRADSDLSLGERVALADRVRADLFVSLHFNSAAPHAGPSGIETFCLTPVGMVSTLVRGFPDDTRIAFPNNSFDRVNLQLAYKLHYEIVAETRAIDHGVKRARFMAVLKNQNRPAVLIEGGYLSNPAEVAQIRSAEYRERLAQAVARALR